MRRFAAAVLCSVLMVAIVCQCQSRAQSNLADRPRQPLLHPLKPQQLSVSDRDLAQQLEIWDMLQELYSDTSPPSRERAISLRQKIRETILESYFDAESVQAEAFREQRILEAKQELLVAKRDRRIMINNATNFITSGTLNTVGSVLQFSNSMPPLPGNLLQMLSGVVSMTMSTYSLKQLSGGKNYGQGSPTILAELFGRPTDERTTYPESVWRFLHGCVPSMSITRAQQLEARWIENNQLEKHGSRRENLKLDLVCGLRGNEKEMTLDDLNDEISMVSDVGTEASLMAHHLRDLLNMIDSDVIQLSTKSEVRQ